MRKSYLPIIIFVPLMIAAFLSPWLYPQASPVFGIVSLLFSLALSIYTIFQTHKRTENARAKILKEVGVMVLTLVVIIFLGGVAAMLANFHVSLRFGAVMGLVSAVVVSFAIGYAVRKGMGRLI